MAPWAGDSQHSLIDSYLKINKTKLFENIRAANMHIFKYDYIFGCMCFIFFWVNQILSCESSLLKFFTQCMTTEQNLLNMFKNNNRTSNLMLHNLKLFKNNRVTIIMSLILTKSRKLWRKTKLESINSESDSSSPQPSQFLIIKITYKRCLLHIIID